MGFSWHLQILLAANRLRSACFVLCLSKRHANDRDEYVDAFCLRRLFRFYQYCL